MVVLAASVVGFMRVCSDTSEIPVSHKRCLKNLQGACLNLVLTSFNFSSVTNQRFHSFLFLSNVYHAHWQFNKVNNVTE